MKKIRCFTYIIHIRINQKKYVYQKQLESEKNENTAKKSLQIYL